MRTSTRPTLNVLLLLLIHVPCAYVSSFTIQVGHASISVECVLSMTLLLVFNLGHALERGDGVVAPDYPAAVDWYRRAADTGHGGASYNLSNMYAVGRGRGVIENEH